MIPVIDARLPFTARCRLLDRAGRIGLNDVAARRRFIRDVDWRYGAGTGDELLAEVDAERDRITQWVDAHLARFGTSREDLRRRAAGALRRLEYRQRVRAFRAAAARARCRRCGARPRAHRGARRGPSRSRDPDPDGPAVREVQR